MYRPLFATESIDLEPDWDDETIIFKPDVPEFNLWIVEYNKETQDYDIVQKSTSEFFKGKTNRVLLLGLVSGLSPDDYGFLDKWEKDGYRFIEKFKQRLTPIAAADPFIM